MDLDRPQAANLHHKQDSASRSGSPAAAEHDDAGLEAQHAECRTVIANNKAWESAEAVRRERLAVFVTPKTAPKVPSP